MGAKGTQTSQTNQSQSYTPTDLGQINSALAQGQAAAQLPFNITAAPVAGFSGQQQQAFGQTGQYANAAQPYFGQAANYFNQAGQGPNISQFFNPYAGAVTAQMQNIFGEQNAQNTGSLTQAAGGVGADRIAVGQADLANQQGLAAGQTLAGLYAPSLQAAQNQQGIQQSIGQNYANLGQNVQGAGLSGAQALYGSGLSQQQQQQAQLNSPYQLSLAAAAFPYQQAQFNAGITGALAPAAGGTTTGQGQTTSQYNPSLTSQIAGGALALGSVGSYFLNRGGAVSPYASGGGVGGSVDDEPIDLSQWFPQLGNISAAQSKAPTLNMSAPAQSGAASNNGKGSLSSMMSGAGKDIGGLSNLGSALMGGSPNFGGGDIFSGDAYGGSASNPLPGNTASDYGMARGGRRNPYANGGSISDKIDRLHHKALDRALADGGAVSNPYAFDDGGNVDPDNIETRFDATKQAIASGAFDPVGANETDFAGTPGMQASNAGITPLPAARPGGSMADAGDDASDVTATPSGASGVSAPANSAPTSGTMPNPYAPPASSTADDGKSLGGFFKSPQMGLLMAGLGAWTPGGISGGLQAGVKAFQGQESVDQGAKRLAQEAQRLQMEAQQQNFGQTQLSAYQKASLDRSKFIPMGQLMTASGEVHPLVMDQAAGKVIDAVTGQAPTRGDQYQGKGAGQPLPAETLSMMADAYIAGDHSVVSGLGYGSVGAQNRAALLAAIQKKAAAAGLSGRDLTAAKIDLTASGAAASTAARQSAGIDRAVVEAKNTFPLAEQASAAVPRGKWIPLNRAEQMFKAGTSDPALGQFMVANQGAITAYAAAMGRGNPVTTVHAQQHAEELLNTAGSHESYVARLRQMDKEMDAAQAAPGQVRANIRNQITGQTGQTSAPANSNIAPDRAALEKEMRARGLLQ